MTRISQHGLTKGQPCPAILVALSDSMSGRALGAVYLDFGKAFDTSPYSILVRPSWDVTV